MHGLVFTVKLTQAWPWVPHFPTQRPGLVEIKSGKSSHIRLAKFSEWWYFGLHVVKLRQVALSSGIPTLSLRSLVLLKDWLTCSKCQLHQNRTNTMKSYVQYDWVEDSIVYPEHEMSYQVREKEAKNANTSSNFSECLHLFRKIVLKKVVRRKRVFFPLLTEE